MPLTFHRPSSRLGATKGHLPLCEGGTRRRLEPSVSLTPPAGRSQTWTRVNDKGRTSRLVSCARRERDGRKHIEAADAFTARVMNAAVGGALNCIQSRSTASRGETKAFSYRSAAPTPPTSPMTASRSHGCIMGTGH